MQNTQVEIRFFHKNQEPPLQTYDLGDDINDPPVHNEFYPNEVGWQDTITVTVKYQLPLLPGPGGCWRNMPRPRAGARTRWRRRSSKTAASTPIPCRPQATIGNEGEKSGARMSPYQSASIATSGAR